MDSLPFINNRNSGGGSAYDNTKKSSVDWWMFFGIVPIVGFGLVVMNNFIAETGQTNFFDKQIIWASIGFLIILILSRVDFRFLRRTPVVTSIYAASVALLMMVFIFGYTAKGAKSWISLGGFSIQPADFAKLAIIILLAKYFSRRHVEIRYVRHIIVSGVYAFILFFLPEYETDFIFAAFAEEWGFIGIILLFVLFGLVFARIFHTALRGETNFETLFALGVAIFFMTHLAINIGMNIGLMPLTGIPVPFMSYGGSHLLVECIAVGILMGMGNYSRPMHRDTIKNEFLGIA